MKNSETTAIPAMKPWLRLTLITMTVGGGFTGVAITLRSLVTPQNQPPAYYVIMIGFLGIFAFITISGLLFVQNPQRIRPLMVALALQIPWVSSPLITYKLAAGFQVCGAFIGGHFGGGFRLGTDFEFFLFRRLPWGIGINLFPLFILALLRRSTPAPQPTGALPINETAKEQTTTGAVLPESDTPPKQLIHPNTI